MKPLCIYHGQCDDGFGAAWAVRKALGDGNVEFYPGVHQKDPPDVAGRDVIMVDFSYKRPVLDAMAAKAKSILILDHHKSAQEDLHDLPEPPTMKGKLTGNLWETWLCVRLNVDRPVAAIFDMNRSGAGLAWDFFVGGPRPRFVDYIEDRDLWRKRLAHGDEFTIALRSYPQDFEVWDHLSNDVKSLLEQGHVLQRYYRRRVEEFKRSAYGAYIDGHLAMIANAPYFAASDVAGELCLEYPLCAFGACYFEVESGRFQYSLRSRGEFDVSSIARVFGGGGHRRAGGFAVNKIVHTKVEP